MSVKSRLLNILFWSVISAAFIGPGTLTTASAAGASFKFQLVWALVFATLACIVLQEMAARITIASGMEIGKTIKRSQGLSWLAYFIGFGVILGCAAYEAGNILGALAGVELLFEVNRKLLTLIIGLICAFLLWWGSVKIIANILGILVAIMGIAFVYVAIQVDVSALDFAQGLVPSIPKGSEWLVLGLVGTTIVPYNLFLGSGISKGQDIGNMRFGLGISILLGGLVSVAILVAGSKIEDVISFQNLALVMGESMGAWAKIMLAIGLFAAGFTSSVTAPLAAGMLAKSVINSESHRGYKITWIIVLSVGVLFGMSEVKPIPVIIAAQALNGMILPVVAMFLIIQANNIKLMGAGYMNGTLFNLVSLIILNAVFLIGINNLFKATNTALNLNINDDVFRLLYMEMFSLPFMAFTIYKIRQLRKNNSD